MKRVAPAAERNERFILETFGPRLPSTGRVLEVASGSGQHAVAFARAYPTLEWVPSDPDPAARASIDAYRADYGGNNLLAAIDLDVNRTWPIDAVDAVININMIHISPWSATEALLTGAAARLPTDGPLLLYGPYRRNGVHTAPSNERFDEWLKSNDPAYGVRDLERVAEFAANEGFDAPEVIDMPANNFGVIFRRL